MTSHYNHLSSDFAATEPLHFMGQNGHFWHSLNKLMFFASLPLTGKWMLYLASLCKRKVSLENQHNPTKMYKLCSEIFYNNFCHACDIFSTFETQP